MKLFIATESPYRWIILNSRNQVKDTGIATALENFRVPKGIEQVIGVVGGEKVSCHSVRIPGKRKSHVESALGYALEDRLSEDVEQLHFKLLAWNPDDVTLAAVVSREQLDSWIDKFRMEGIFLDAIIPEYFLLPVHDKTDVTLSLLADGNICIRLSQHQGMTLDRDGFDFWWESRKEFRQQILCNRFCICKRTLEQSGLRNWFADGKFDFTLGYWQWVRSMDTTIRIVR